MEHRHLKHFFDVDIARKYGILEAVILENIRYWLIHNEVSGINFREGKYWTYNSVKAFTELFPEATEKQIRRALDKLRKAGLLITGNFNKEAWDRSLWYTFSEEGWKIFGDFEENNENFHLPKRGNGLHQMGEPIPNINTNNRKSENNSNARARENFSFDDCINFFQENFDNVTPYRKSILENLNADYGPNTLMQAMIDSCELGGKSLTYVKRNLLRYHDKLHSAPLFCAPCTHG